MGYSSSRHQWRFYALFIASLLLTSPLNVKVVLPLQNEAVPTYASEMIGAVPRSPIGSIDLNRDGSAECIHWDASAVRIDNCTGTASHMYWQSPEQWQVVQWTVSDLNHDEYPELTLLVWRDFAPWPIERDAPDGGRLGTFHDAHGKSCQVIMIGGGEAGFKEIWAGSALANPILSLLAADIDRDGLEELVAIEGEYRQPAAIRSGPVTIWKWNGFGFDLSQRLDGSFRHLALLDKSRIWIIASQ